MLIEARNAEVSERLENVYKAKSKGNLRVFCVSSRAYEDFTSKGDDEMVDKSGIPALRCFCLATAADTQLQDSKHFLTSKLTRLLSSVQIWLDQCGTKQESTDQQTINNLSKRLVKWRRTVSVLQ
jgi:hypothetical protein